jgi:ribonuclease E
VTREAARGKNPVLELIDAPHPGGAPRRLAQHECDAELAQAKPADAETRARLDAAIEAALARTAPIPGGGALIIEPTAALVAIDVDSGARAGAGDAERFALELNIAAAREAAHQVRLRGLGGVIAIDFVSLRRPEHRARLVQEAKAAFADDPWSLRFGALSVFGVFELARAQLRAPLHETLCDADGRQSVESVALAALRAVEREAATPGGRRIACTVAPEVKAWLDATDLDWRAALNGRIGARWSLDSAPGPRHKIDARAL